MIIGEDTREEFEMIFEGELKPKGFTMANFTVLVDYMENEESDYLFYDVYSICKLKVIYQVSKKYPEAGAFAPCSLAVYQERDSEEIVIEFPSVYNWINAMDIKDKKALAELEDAQSDMEEILDSLTY